LNRWFAKGVFGAEKVENALCPFLASPVREFALGSALPTMIIASWTLVFLKLDLLVNE
jgi:hypothetical protein